VGPSASQKKALERQEQEAQRSENRQVKTMQQDLQQQTLEVMRRYGGMARGGMNGMMTGSSPLRGR